MDINSALKFMSDITISDNHEYTVDGLKVPSVSEILNVYFPPCGFYTEEGQQDGKYRHEWYAALAQGIETTNAPYPKIAPAIDGFKKFLADVKPVYVSGEIPYHHPTLRYCGTPDVVFRIGDRLVVTDFKPQQKNKRTRIQTALYMLLLQANKIPVQYRYELRCYDGIYRFEQHEDLQDMRRAEIMVAAFHASQFYK